MSSQTIFFYLFSLKGGLLQLKQRRATTLKWRPRTYSRPSQYLYLLEKTAEHAVAHCSHFADEESFVAVLTDRSSPGGLTCWADRQQEAGQGSSWSLMVPALSAHTGLCLSSSTSICCYLYVCMWICIHLLAPRQEQLFKRDMQGFPFELISMIPFD